MRRIQTGFGQGAAEHVQVRQIPLLQPHPLEQGGQHGVALVAVDGGGGQPHGHQGVHRKVRILVQGDAVTARETLHIPAAVAPLGGHRRRRGVTGGLEHAAQQHGPVAQGGAGAPAQARRLGPRQIGRGAAHIKEKFQLAAHWRLSIHSRW